MRKKYRCNIKFTLLDRITKEVDLEGKNKIEVKEKIADEISKYFINIQNVAICSHSEVWIMRKNEWSSVGRIEETWDD